MGRGVGGAWGMRESGGGRRPGRRYGSGDLGPADRGDSKTIRFYSGRTNHPHRKRCLQLFAVISRWPAPESLAPVLGWTVDALGEPA
jgi:hypothetical protein